MKKHKCRLAGNEWKDKTRMKRKIWTSSRAGMTKRGEGEKMKVQRIETEM